MMKRIFGFCDGCCAVAGVLAGPDNDINIVAPSSMAQDALYDPSVLHGAVGIAGLRSVSLQSSMASSSRSIMKQRLLVECTGNQGDLWMYRPAPRDALPAGSVGSSSARTNASRL
jgi:hypothetical protein